MDRKVDNQSRANNPAFCLKLYLISFQLFQLPELEFPVLGVGTWYKSLVDKELQPNESLSYRFAYTAASYRVYSISNTTTGRCALLILEWGVATLFQDRDGYMASILEISCTQDTLTIKNKSNSNVYITLK